MIEDRRGPKHTNPFSSRFLVPGSIHFFFQDSQTLDSLIDRIQSPGKFAKSCARRLAIVGPHGTGKSTLLSEIGSRIESEPIVLHSTMTKFESTQQVLARIHHQTLCLVDGFEQLPWWGRRLCVCVAKLRGATLCVTSHNLPLGFELLLESRVDTRVENYVVGCLLSGLDSRVYAALLSSQAWRESRRKHGQNLRESLFDMYDWWRDTVDEASVSG